MEGDIDLIHELLFLFENNVNEKMHMLCGKFSYVTKGICIESGTGSQ